MLWLARLWRHAPTGDRTGNRDPSRQARTAVASISTMRAGSARATTPMPVSGGSGVTPSLAATRAAPSTTKDPAIRTRLIERADQMLRAREPITLRSLVAGTGVSTMAVYTYFGDMPGMWKALRQEGFTRLAVRFATVPLSADPLQDLAALVAAYLRNALDHPDLYRVMFDATFDLENLEAADATLEHLVQAARRARAPIACGPTPTRWSWRSRAGRSVTGWSPWWRPAPSPARRSVSASRCSARCTSASATSPTAAAPRSSRAGPTWNRRARAQRLSRAIAPRVRCRSQWGWTDSDDCPQWGWTVSRSRP